MYLSLAAGSQVLVQEKVDVELLDEQGGDEDDDDDEADQDGPRHSYYRSDKILGQLYDAVDEEKIWHQDIQLPRLSPNDNAFWHQMLVVLEQRVAAASKVNCMWRNRLDEAHGVRHTSVFFFPAYMIC